MSFGRNSVASLSSSGVSDECTVGLVRGKYPRSSRSSISITHGKKNVLMSYNYIHSLGDCPRGPITNFGTLVTRLDM